MSMYTSMPESQFLNSLEADLTAAAARLMGIAMRREEAARHEITIVAQAMITASRKVRKHLEVPSLLE